MVVEVGERSLVQRLGGRLGVGVLNHLPVPLPVARVFMLGEDAIENARGGWGRLRDEAEADLDIRASAKLHADALIASQDDADRTYHELEEHAEAVDSAEVQAQAAYDGGDTAAYETVQPTLDQILEKIAHLVEGTEGVLVGMVNIHTDQAELLIEHFEHLQGDSHRSELEESRDPARMPPGTQRLHRAVAHPADERAADA